MNLDGKVIVVTGGAGLLGRSFVEAIAGAGATAVIAEIDQQAARSAMDEIDSGKGEVVCMALDITSPESVKDCIAQLHGKYGRIDGVVNNAYPRNSNYGRHLFDVEYQDLCENMNSHLGGYFLVAQQFARYFKDQGWGSIVNMASIYGVVAPRFDIYEGTSMTTPVEYALIKSGVIQLTSYLAAYMKNTGVRVNAISPGGIEDGQPDSFLKAYRQQCLNKGMLQPEDIVGMLLFLLSDSSKAINGQNLIVDDGFTL